MVDKNVIYLCIILVEDYFYLINNFKNHDYNLTPGDIIYFNIFRK